MASTLRTSGNGHTTRNKKLLGALLGARTLLGAPDHQSWGRGTKSTCPGPELTPEQEEALKKCHACRVQRG